MPAQADVYLNCADLGNGVIQLSYINEEPIPIRAFSLDITVSAGIITAVGNLSPHYWVYRNSIYIDEYGEIVDLSVPVPKPGYPGTLGGLGTSGMTIEMGSLYIGEPNAPPFAGVLLTFTITAECSITVEENAICGGIVFEDPKHNAPVHSPGLAGVLPPEHEEYGGGSGTAADPFLIFSAEQLNTIALNPGDLYKNFKLAADIDLSGYMGTDFNIIGTYFGYAFGGVFDGNNHSISNFTYASNDADYVGLFGYVDGTNAQIKDLDLISPDVNAQSGDNVGPLVGYLRTGTICRCSAQAGAVAGDSCVGGLVGRNYLGTFVNCYATTNVFGNENLGGLVGRTYVEVSNCYSTGSVHQYADPVGGLVGFNHGTISSSFYDQQTSQQQQGAGGAGGSAVTDVNGMPTAQMKTQTTFADAGWDFKGETANGT
ncbi:MAG: GLUG motif-containing protein, partial [Planctomycetota bacterium]